MPNLFNLIPEPEPINIGLYDTTYKCPRCNTTWIVSIDKPSSDCVHICGDWNSNCRYEIFWSRCGRKRIVRREINKLKEKS
jgi:hypothetical protein